MTTPDYPDFAQPVFNVDQVTGLYGQPFAAAIISNGGPISADTSRYQSIGISLTPPAVGGANRYALEVIWTEGNTTVAEDDYTFHDSLSYDGINSFMISLPVRGSLVIMRVVGDDGATLQLSVVGSTRVVQGGQLGSLGPSRKGRWIAGSTTSLAASGGQVTVIVPPVERAVLINASYQVTSGNLSIHGVYRTAGAVMNNIRLELINSSATVGWNSGELVIPRTGLILFFTNNDAALHTGTVSVWDVS